MRLSSLIYTLYRVYIGVGGAASSSSVSHQQLETWLCTSHGLEEYSAPPTGVHISRRPWGGEYAAENRDTLTVTTAPITTWQGCYADSWQDLIVPGAFAHPAKYARGLIHRIYRHLLEHDYVREGDTVLDPFAGVGLGALDALTYGLRYVGVELEPKFVTLAQQNVELWRQRYGLTGAQVLQGDSRRLREVLAGAQAGCVVGSPPYAESINSERNGIDWSKTHHGSVERKHGHNPHSAHASGVMAYGVTEGQLGAMPPGCVVGSPPYEGCLSSEKNGIDWSKAQEGGKVATPARQASGKGYGSSAGQLGAMPPGAVVSSPPWDGGAPALVPERQRETSSPRDHGGPGPQYQAMAVLGEPDTFWSASAQIMQELAAILPAGAVCAWVLKAYVSKKAIVPFPQQWLALCEQHGFVLVEEIHASLVEDHGTQHSLFGEAQRVTTEKKSFFRRLAEKKGSPRIDHETVLLVRRMESLCHAL